MMGPYREDFPLKLGEMFHYELLGVGETLTEHGWRKPKETSAYLSEKNPCEESWAHSKNKGKV